METDHTRADAVLEAITAIQATRATHGAVDCPLCKGTGVLRFRQELRRKGRSRARLVLEAKCSTPACLEFLS